LAAERSFVFPLPLGLHARPASRIQQAAARFRSTITWINARTGVSADLRSTLSLLTTDTQPNDPCRLAIEGPDEAEALASLARFIEAELPILEAADAEPPAPASSAADVPRVLEIEKTLYFSGLAASAGIIRGPALLRDPALEADLEGSAAGRSPAEESAAFRAAAASLESDIKARRDAATNAVERAVLDAHRAILGDPAFAASVDEAINRGGLSSAGAVARASRFFASALRASRSAYLRERMADVRDISHQLIARLSGAEVPVRVLRLAAPSVLVAADLPPSEFLSLDRTRLLGLVLENAGATSHTLILARARGIPAVAGIPGLLDRLQPGEEILVDGGRGLLIPSPPPAVVRYFDRDKAALEEKAARFRAESRRPGRTADGRRIEIAANIGHPEELAPAWTAGAEGIGLFRTELLLLDRTSPPGEEEQTELYSRIARAAEGRPVIIRTFDIGGDKPIPYLPMPAESNPFLGFRGIRTYDRFGDLIRAQLRAILRAAVHGPLKIMFPMVGAVEEMIAARERLAGIRAELEREGLPHGADVETGMMVEVPSAALLVDRFADHADFFSIGSNDLLQYAMAADRGNPSVRALDQPLHPAFLRLLRIAVDAAHGRGKWIGLCGELAASRRALPLLVGLGFDELSMAAASVPETKARLGALDSASCRGLLEAALAASRASDVEALLSAFASPAAAEESIVPGLIKLGADCRSRSEALAELAIMMEQAGRTDDRAAFEQALWRREDTFSTGIGFGVAIPHCQTDAVGGVSIAVLRPAAPIAWSAADGDPVDLIVMLALPAGGAAQEHLRLLAQISRRLVHDEFREALRAATDADSVIQILKPSLSGAKP